jgi:hypothetical protein
MMARQKQVQQILQGSFFAERIIQGNFHSSDCWFIAFCSGLTTAGVFSGAFVDHAVAVGRAFLARLWRMEKKVAHVLDFFCHVVGAGNWTG